MSVSKKRIFFALWPSDRQRQKIDAAIEPYKEKLAGKWTPRSNWHITLVFIGGFAVDDLAALQRAAGSIRCPGIALRFQRIDYWKRPKIMVLSTDFVCNELLELVRALQNAATRFGHTPETRAYSPHLTIARKARFFEPITLAQPLELRWSSFRLIESVSAPAGVQYRPLDQ